MSQLNSKQVTEPCQSVLCRYYEKIAKKIVKEDSIVSFVTIVIITVGPALDKYSEFFSRYPTGVFILYVVVIWFQYWLHRQVANVAERASQFEKRAELAEKAITKTLPINKVNFTELYEMLGGTLSDEDLCAGECGRMIEGMVGSVGRAKEHKKSQETELTNILNLLDVNVESSKGYSGSNFTKYLNTIHHRIEMFQKAIKVSEKTIENERSKVTEHENIQKEELIKIFTLLDVNVESFKHYSESDFSKYLNTIHHRIEMFQEAIKVSEEKIKTERIKIGAHKLKYEAVSDDLYTGMVDACGKLLDVLDENKKIGCVSYLVEKSLEPGSESRRYTSPPDIEIKGLPTIYKKPDLTVYGTAGRTENDYQPHYAYKSMIDDFFSALNAFKNINKGMGLTVAKDSGGHDGGGD